MDKTQVYFKFTSIYFPLLAVKKNYNKLLMTFSSFVPKYSFLVLREQSKLDET